MKEMVPIKDNVCLLVDGMNLAFRAFYALKDLRRSDGFPTNALHAFVGSLWNLEKRVAASQKLIFFDVARSPRRLALLPTYKAHRKAAPDDFKRQLPHLKRLAWCLGYAVFEDPELEADDLIAAWAKKKEESVIVSADKDFGQCVNAHVRQAIPQSGGEWILLGVEDIRSRWGVRPDQMVDFLSLTGDAADNVDGIPGVGPKTASRWLEKYGSVEALLRSVDDVEPERFRPLLKVSREQLERNRRLIRLTAEGVLSDPPAAVVRTEDLLAFLKEMELHSLARQARERYGSPSQQSEFCF